MTADPDRAAGDRAFHGFEWVPGVSNVAKHYEEFDEWHRSGFLAAENTVKLVSAASAARRGVDRAHLLRGLPAVLA